MRLKECKVDSAEIFLIMLSKALDADYHAICDLIENRYKCNDDLANDPNIVVLDNEHGEPCVGMLGIVNGYLNAIKSDKLIAAMYDTKTKALLGFTTIDRQ